MQFLYPGFLWALLLLAIPIIIHLFYFRRFKKVYFTNVRFLKEVKQETSNRSRIKNLLVLLSRLLALAALVIAFAQPILTDKDEIDNSPKAVSIFLDNSFSMEALSSEVPLIDLAKDKVRDIVNAYRDNDQFQIVTHDFEGRHQRFYSKDNILSLIDEVQISPAVNLLSVAMDRLKQSLSKEDANKELYIVSDFQQNITDFDIVPDSSYQIHLIPLQSVQEKNVSIDSVWLAAPVPMLNQENPLVIKLSNYSDSEAEDVQLSLEYQGQIRPLGTKQISPNSSVTDTVNFSILQPGWHEADIAITDYPISFDNRYKIALKVSEKVKILSINESGTNKYLKAAFTGLKFFEIENQTASRINYSEFVGQDLIILNEISQLSSGLSSSIKDYVSAGGNLLIFPAKSISKESYNSLLSSLGANTIINSESGSKQVGTINTEEFIFKDVYLNQQRNIKYPSSTFNYTFSNFQSRKGEDLLKYRDGTSFLSKYRVSNGNAYIFATPLNDQYSDLVRNAEVFIPMLYKMGISKAKKDNIAYTIGKDYLIETDNVIRDDEIIYTIKGKDEFIPAQFNIGSKIMLDVKDQVREAGFYQLSLDDQEISRLAFNYNRLESDLKYFSPEVLIEKFGDESDIISSADANNLSEYISQSSSGIPLWKWFIIAVLVFLGLETLLLRFWKT